MALQGRIAPTTAIPEYDRAIREFQRAPNIGPAMARDLYRLGYERLADLHGENAESMYARLCMIDGVQHDICVLDVFEAVVRYVTAGDERPWWAFSRERKARSVAQ